jgi:hypothetical protein
MDQFVSGPADGQSPAELSDYLSPERNRFWIILRQALRVCGEGSFLKAPSVIFGGCPIVSPLRFGRENLEVMMDATRLGLVSDIAVAP